MLVKKNRQTRSARSGTKATTQPATAQLTYAVFSSDFGWMSCVWRGELLEANTFAHRSRDAAREAAFALTDGTVMFHAADMGEPHVASLVERMQNYAAGEPDDFRGVRLNLARFTRFQSRVLETVRKIPPGVVRSYGEVAKLAGAPGAARAAGTVMSKNRYPLIIPCHRVVGSGGTLGGYSCPLGVEMKIRLLGREGVALAKS